MSATPTSSRVTAGAQPTLEYALPPGHSLRGYRILHTIGAGGFGITYLAEEPTTHRRVVLKENFPASLCYRRPDSPEVLLNPADSAESSFAWAHNNFMREARLLASLHHPHIAKVYTFFEAYNTSYYVTEHIAGQPLAEVAAAHAQLGQLLPQAGLLGTLVRVLDALDYIHSRDLLHRDIKPNNILIRKNGLPVLIDFGAARDACGDADPNVVESLGFSPAEQGNSGSDNMGPWTDLYSLGATLYYITTGQPLLPCRQRELYDTAETLSELPELLAVYDKVFLATIDRAIRPIIAGRFASAAEWIAALRPLFS